MSVGIDLGPLLPSQYESPGGAGVEGVLGTCEGPGPEPSGGACIIWGSGPKGGQCSCGDSPDGGACIIGSKPA